MRSCLLSLKRTETVRVRYDCSEESCIQMHQKPASAIVYAARLALYVSSPLNSHKSYKVSQLLPFMT